MKNNDQRKEWLRNYQSWGLWYEDEHIGVRYYRYKFDNGAQLIAEEYPAAGKRDFTASYLHLVGGPEPPNIPVTAVRNGADMNGMPSIRTVKRNWWNF